MFKLTREGKRKIRNNKKFLTKEAAFGKISKLSLEKERQEP